MAFFVPPQGIATVLVPAGGSIAVYCQGQASVSRTSTPPNYPDTTALIGTVNNGQVVFGPFTPATSVQIDASGGVQVWYEVGTAPQVQQARLSWQVQPVTAGVLNVTGALTFALIASGVITSTTAAAVTGTLPTGAVLDASSTFAIGDSTDWSVINTGAANAFTVAAAAGHTIVGSATVALSTSGRFRTTKTAANTFVTYRIG